MPRRESSSSKKPAAGSAISPASLTASALARFSLPTRRCTPRCRKSPPKSPRRRRKNEFFRRLLLGLPLLIQLGDGRSDGEAPGENRKVLEFFRNRVARRRFFRGNSGLEHFLRMLGQIIKDRPRCCDSFLPAELSVARNKQRVLIERRELPQRRAPSGNRGVERARIPPGKQQLRREIEGLTSSAHD